MDMAEDGFDIVVIGSGPGGYVAAIRAAQLGLKTAIIERERLGGICLNWGCIPTKALLRASELYGLMREAEEFGLTVKEVGFDFAKVIARSRKVADRLSAGVAFLMKKHKITVVEGEAKLAGQGRIAVTGKAARTLTAKHIVLATGARARALPNLKPDGKAVWTYRDALVPDRMPKSLLVIGAGAIGIEFASFYRTLGAEVTVVEALDRVVPVEDHEVSAFLLKALKKQGIGFHLGATVEAVETGASKQTVRLKTADGEAASITVEKVLLAIGITGNVEGLGLEEAGIKVEKGHVTVDQWGATGAPGLYAIGDLVGPPWLAHKAMHEAVACVERIAGVQGAEPVDYGNVPACTYCQPQVASVGLTEQACKEQKREVRIGRFPYRGNGKALALGEEEGFIKTIFDAKTGALLGAHMIGAEVTELIQGYAVARTLETTEAELMHTVYPHPTLSEMMHESVLDAFGRALHF
jgi:dihydrolipoamide dehydrogenase